LESAQGLNIGNLIILGSLGMITLVSFIIVFIVLYQKKMLAHKSALQKNETEFQKQLLDASVEVAEQERRKIAANIHDDVGLTINVVKLNLSKIKNNVKDTKLVNELIETDLKILEDIHTTLRGISHELMPPSLSLLGLLKGLKEMSRQITSSGKMKVDLVAGDFDLRIEKKKELQLYRLIKELINNIIKHAGAQQIVLTCELENNELTTTIEHDGIGISDKEVAALISSQKGIGLKSIQSRVQLTNSKLNYLYSPAESLSTGQADAKIVIKTPV
jgi:two-component system NarL family sensor kinase